MTITFSDLSKKYDWAQEFLDFNERLAFDENNPAHAAWLHHPTLARWFYRSSKEVLREYREVSKEFKSPSQEASLMEIAQAGELYSNLKARLQEFSEKLLAKFPEDRLLQEALAE